MSLDSLLPDLPVPPRWWEVTVTVPHEDDEALVPASAPRGRDVVSVWTAAQAIVTVKVKAETMPEAAVIGLAAAGELAQRPGASAEIRPVS